VTVNATIPTKYLKAVAPFIAKNDYREYLCGVHLAPGRLEASDGPRALRILSDQILSDSDVVLSWGTVTAMLRSARKEQEIVIASGTYCGVSMLTLEGKYPDIDRLLPEPGGPGKVGHYNPELLLGFFLAAKALGIRFGYHRLYQRGSEGALVTFPGCPEVRGIVMPWD